MAEYMNIIDELKKNQVKNNKSSNRIAFLALKTDITLAINEGYSAKEIWELLYQKKLITVQYRAFMVYVKRYITDQSNDNNIVQYKIGTKNAIADKETAAVPQPPKIKQSFQATPDWDANSDFGENPILAELKKQGIDLPKK